MGMHDNILNVQRGGAPPSAQPRRADGAWHRLRETPHGAPAACLWGRFYRLPRMRSNSSSVSSKALLGGRVKKAGK